jgi:hypothetical protein
LLSDRAGVKQLRQTEADKRHGTRAQKFAARRFHASDKIGADATKQLERSL